MIVDIFIIENNQITLYLPYFLPKTGMGLPKTAVSFCGD